MHCEVLFYRSAAPEGMSRCAGCPYRATQSLPKISSIFRNDSPEPWRGMTHRFSQLARAMPLCIVLTFAIGHGEGVLAQGPAQAQATAEKSQFFEREVAPLLKANC